MDKNQESNVKIAVVQATPPCACNCVEKGVEVVVRLSREAAKKGAKIILFPESFLPGYPQNLNLLYEEKDKFDGANENYMQFYNNSVEEDSNLLAPIAEVARETGCYIMVGISERSDEKLYCSALLYNPQGILVKKHRKLRPTGFERVFWEKEEGNELSVVETEYGTIGVAICWENYMPLLRAALYAQGTNLYFAPAADSSAQWQATLQHIALEGRCFVICCNHYCPEASELEGGRPKYNGGSAVLNPYGEYIAGPLFGQEGILYADLDLTDNNDPRYDFDHIAPEMRFEIMNIAESYEF